MIKVQGIADKGSTIVTAGITSTTHAIESFNSATVQVYQTGTVTLVSLFSDAAGTVPKANPFTSSASDASWSFYCAPQRIDIRFSGSTIASPFTLADITVGDPGSTPAESYASLNAAVTDIGATETTLVVSTASFPTGASCTVPSTLILEWRGEGNLLRGAGHTVIIDSDSHNWPLKKLFYGTGLTRFTSTHALTTVYPHWFGAVGDASTDDTTAWTELIAAIPNYTTVVLPSGFRSKISSTLTFTSKKGITLTTTGTATRGLDILSNANAAGFLWYGGAAAMINLVTTPSMTIRGLGFEAKASTTGATQAILITSTGAEGDILIEQNFINYDGQPTAGAFEGVSINPTGAANNCENIKIRDNNIAGSNSTTNTNANRGMGVKIGNNANIKGIEIDGNWFTACYRGIYQLNGWFTSRRCFSTYSTFDVDSTGNASPCTIEGWNSESANQVFRFASGLYIVRGSNWSNYSTTGTVVLNGNATLIAEGNEWLPSGSAPTDAATISYDVNSTGNAILSKGNQYLNETNTISGFADCEQGALSEIDNFNGITRYTRYFGPTVGSGSSGPGKLTLIDVAVANLGFGPTVNGTTLYSSDATAGTAPATGGGSGAMIDRVNGVWVARPSSFSGTGAAVLVTSPTLVTPTLGVAAATSLTIANTGKLRIAPKTNDTWGAAISLDVTISNHDITGVFGTSATSTITPTAAGSAGDWIFINTINGAGGSVVVTFASTFHSSGTQTTQASRYSSIAFRSTGSVWVEQYRTTDLT